MGYDSIRLERADGVVIAYFAPSFEVVPQDSNQVFESPRSGDRETIVRDNGLWTSELTVQGAFVHSEDMQPDFREAVQDLFGQQTVTPDDQVNRLREMTVYSDAETLHLYHRDNEYTATSSGQLDPGNGVYPAVAPNELRTPEEGEVSSSRIDFMVRLSVGLSRN